MATRAVHRSHSQLTEYAECSYRYYLRRVAGTPERPAVWFAGGRAVHAVTEEWDRAEVIAPGEMSRSHIRAAWDRQWTTELDRLRETEPDEARWRTAGRKTSDKPEGENAAWWAVAGLEMCERYAAWREEEADRWELWTLPDGKPAIEVPLAVDMGGVWTVGAADRIFADRRTGAPLLVDIKTGSREPGTDLQLADYAHKVRKLHGVDVWYGAYWMARTGHLTAPKLISYSPEEIDHLYKQLEHAVTQQVWLPTIGSHCRQCGVKEHCEFSS